MIILPLTTTILIYEVISLLFLKQLFCQYVPSTCISCFGSPTRLVLRTI